MSRKTVLSILAVITIILHYSCATIQQLVQKPTVTFEGISLKDMSLFEGTLLFNFKVTNPNPIGTKIRNIAYDLKINDKEFLEGTFEKGIKIAANGSNTVGLPITIEYLNLFQSVTEFIQSDRVAYDLSGIIGVGPFDIPYQTEGELDIPKLPELSLKKIEVSDFSLTGASVLFQLELRNDNSFVINPSGLDFSIKLGGIEFSEGTSSNVSPVGEGDKTTLEIPVNISFLKLGRSAYQLLTTSSSGYELAGEMKFNVPKIGERSFPFQKTGKVPLIK